MDFQQIFVNQNHLIDPAQKDEEWAAKMIYEFYHFGGAVNLLDGKDSEEIEKYAAGNPPVAKYKKMFKRMAKEEAAIQAQFNKQGGGDFRQATPIHDVTGIEWAPLSFLNQPLNSALAVLCKMPIYVKCTAIDALAQEKKEKDFKVLQNRGFHDGQLQQFAQKLGSPIGVPTAPNNAESIDISNFDLDPNKEDELNFYINLFYKLRPESAFECVLLALSYTQDLRRIRDLEHKDQLFFGVSCNQAYFSNMSGLPTARYLWPGNVWTPPSRLPDYDDAPFRYISEDLTAADVMELMGDEMGEAEITEMFDTYWTQKGWGSWSKCDSLEKKKKATVPCIHFNFKSWDAVTFHKKKARSSSRYHTDLVDFAYELRYSTRHPNEKLRGKPKPPSNEDFLKRRWVQNTYTGYWFPFMYDDAAEDVAWRVFKYKILEGSSREKGRESISPWGINIWKSQDKGAVELCIPIIDEAQRAAFKMQHCIIMSKPRGIYVDMRYMRNAVQSLQATDFPMSVKQLFQMLTDNNVFIGDSEGVDPQEVISGSRPFYDIPGGVGEEIKGYLLVIEDAITKISRITGWNDALTGQTPSQDALVGLQKLLLQSAVNSLYYAQTASKNQTEKIFKQWAFQTQYILKYRNSPSAKAIEAICSSYKVAVLQDLHTIPAHSFGIMVENAPTEEQQNDLNNVLIEMFKADRITPVDYFTIRRVFNYKDAQQLLAIRERKQRERKEAELRQQNQAMLAGEQIKANAKLQDSAVKEKGKIQNTITQGEIQKWLAQFGGKLDLILQQNELAAKTSQQRERMAGQLQKAEAVANAHNQQPVPLM